MKTKELLSQIDDNQVLAAIADAESHSSGEIRVYVSHRKAANPRDAAMEQFEKLGMTKTRDRNAILIFVAPESQSFAIIGDEGIHSKCGAEFWEQLAGGMRQKFQEGKFTAGILDIVRAAGKLLAEHFPRREDDENELPDTVAREK